MSGTDRLDRIEALPGGEEQTMPDDEMAFSLDLLQGAAHQPQPALTVCDLGHLVVNRRTHYAPTRVAGNLHAIWFRWVEHEEAP